MGASPGGHTEVLVPIPATYLEAARLITYRSAWLSDKEGPTAETTAALYGGAICDQPEGFDLRIGQSVGQSDRHLGQPEFAGGFKPDGGDLQDRVENYFLAWSNSVRRDLEAPGVLDSPGSVDALFSVDLAAMTDEQLDAALALMERRARGLG